MTKGNRLTKVATVTVNKMKFLLTTGYCNRNSKLDYVPYSKQSTPNC